MTHVLQAPKGFSFGADPELFIVDPNGRPVCADGIIPGTKQEPYPVTGGAVQVDGFAAEFNINPSHSFEEFNTNISDVLTQLSSMLPKGYRLINKPSVVFDEEVWNSAPDHAKTLGCSPDFNAWTVRPNPPPERPEGSRLACAGGHLHVGWTEDADLGDIQHVTNCCDLIKQFDWFLGVWSVKQDQDTARRSLYGNAGSCRFKTYGVEYRALSSFWVLEPSMRLEVWNRMVQAIRSMSLVFYPQYYSHWNDEIVRAINNSNTSSPVFNEFNFPLN